MMIVKLHDICDFYNGGAWSDKEYVEKGIPVLKVTNCKPQGFQINEINYLPLSAEEKYNKNKLQLGDVIIATVGSHPNLVNSAAGRSCVVNSQVEGFYLNQNAVCLRSKDEDILYQKYLGHLCKERTFKHNIQNKGRGAANQMRIAIGAIKDFQFVLPPIETQKRIADILSAYDDLIENNQKQIKLLEEMAQRLYKEWFVDLHFPNCENTKVVDGVPVGWKIKTLDELAVLVMGQSPKSEFYNTNKTGLPFHQGVGSYGGRFVEDEIYTTSYTRIAKAGSILFSVRAPVGRMNYTKNKIAFGRGLASVNHKRGLQSYLFYLLKETFFKDNIVGNGSIFASITKSELQSQKFLVPNGNLDKKFNEIVESIDRKIDAIDNELNLLQESRNRLLPKLMSGELEV